MTMTSRSARKENASAGREAARPTRSRPSGCGPEFWNRFTGSGTPMGEDNVWLQGRLREVAALDAITTALDADHGQVPGAIRGAGAAARAEAAIERSARHASRAGRDLR